MASATTTTPKTRKPLEAVDPLVVLLDYDQLTGTGLLTIDDKNYVMIALREIPAGNRGKTLGMRLQRYCDKRQTVRKIDIDFGSSPWSCDCEDATYQPDRPGGCKHVVALKKVAKEMRCQKAPAK